MTSPPEESGASSQPDRPVLLTVVVPTYNELANIGPLSAAIFEALGDTSAELLVVDDASPDGTGDAAAELARDDPRVRLIRRERKQGLAGAVFAGADAARGAYVCVMDADLSHDPGHLPGMLAKAEEGYDAVFLGHGASSGNELDVPGGDLPGVMMATEYLVRGNLNAEQLPDPVRQPLPSAERVVVIGGGDTSMDCVRTAVRLGVKEVTCAYRRTEAEQKGRIEERVHAREEGVRFEYLAAPLQIEAGEDGSVARVRFARMELGEPDDSGRRRPVPTGEEFEVKADPAVIAIGYAGDAEVARTASGVESSRALIAVDPETFETSRTGVFAGGDCVNGADLVVTALADGRRAAETIHRYLEDKRERPSAIVGLARES